jgi:hypothetical protein
MKQFQPTALRLVIVIFIRSRIGGFAVHQVQLFSRLEAHCLARRDRHLGAGARVASDAGLMAIKSDRWIRQQAIDHQMIVPFSEKQVREGVISYGLSSYGYDLRVSDEFKIFTNVNSAIIDPKAFDERSFRQRCRRQHHRPAQLLRPRALDRVLQDSPRRADHLRRQVHLRALRHHRQRHSV